MRSLNFVIPYVIYPFDVMVSIGEDDEVLKKKLIKHGANVNNTDLSHHHTQRGRCIMFEDHQTLIRLYQFPKTPTQFGHLQHEIFHAVEFVMDRMNMPLTKESDEAYAYLIGYLTTEIYKRLK